MSTPLPRLKPEDTVPQVRMAESSMRQVLELLSRRYGFQFRDAFHDMARCRLLRRLEQLGLDDLQDYYYRLLYDPDSDAEFELLFDRLANNETYFFREESQIWSFAREILESREAGARVRVWSAGCSTGEEPYSLAIATLEAGHDKKRLVEIFGSDQSSRALEKARQGVYGAFSFRSTPAELRQRYFRQEGPDRFRILPEARSMVQFGRCNLLGPRGELPLVKFDAIFCRNVLIYFDKESRREVINLFYEHLAESGYLFLGHSESLLDLSDRFEFATLRNDIAYRRED